MIEAFKAYDIRGVYGRDFNDETVYRIGYFLPDLLSADTVLVGFDCRSSTPEIYRNLTRGITASGADVLSMGLATTPMVYYATATHGFSASVQITASHNPAEYNGLKISSSEALPVGYDTGLAELEKLVESSGVIPSGTRGEVRELTGIKEEYVAFLEKYRKDYSHLNFGVDCSNGMASLIARDVFGDSPEYLFDVMDGTFPNHPPNPLVESNTEDLKRLVKEGSLDIGVIFDGDADRVMFVDDKGRFIRPDLITAVLGLSFPPEETGYVLHDIRTSRGVIEHIRGAGRNPYMWKVGHSHAKRMMRRLNAVYGGELAGHYYFRDFYNCDSGMLAALLVLNTAAELKVHNRRFSDLVDSISIYANSGEINFRIQNKKAAMEDLKDYFCSEEDPSVIYDFDGYRIEFPRWWFNIRPSNTEPFLRLVVEACDEDMLRGKLQSIENLLSSYITPPEPEIG